MLRAWSGLRSDIFWIIHFRPLQQIAIGEAAKQPRVVKGVT
jgi:hypothetical protein